MSDRSDEFEAPRRAMVASQLRTSGVDDPRVLRAMGRVAREDFVPTERRPVAYTDRAVPLSPGRALNPPTATAMLFDAAAIAEGETVLVLGIGTGYALAIASALTNAVTGVEYDPLLAGIARDNLPGEHVLDDIPEQGGPYDVVVIDGAIEVLPEALIAVLAADGRLATGLVEDGVTRLALGRRGGHGFALIAFADAETVLLPGFEKPKAFVF